MSADAVAMVVLILVSVKRPVTRAGLMSDVVPLPLPVEMFAVNELRPVPPLRAPPAPITHDAPVPLALKLPLDWAKASPTANNPVTAKTDSSFFMFLTYGPL